MGTLQNGELLSSEALFSAAFWGLIIAMTMFLKYSIWRLFTIKQVR